MAKFLDKIKFRLKFLQKRREPVPEMVEKRKVIEHYRNQFKPKYFIETGTFLGDTVDFFKSKFECVISIELSEKLAVKANKRFKNDMHVQIIHGDSGKKLPEILRHKTGLVLFWLDGHYSSEFFVKDEYIITAKGETNTPIEKELDCILNSTVIPIILIDDARLFNGTNDYPSIEAIQQKLKSSGLEFSVIVNTDIIQIVPIKC